MATVIDSLLIELGLDTSKFNSAAQKSVEELRDFQEQATKSFKNTQQGAKNAGDGFEKARNALVSLGVAFIGIKGFTNLAQQMTTTNAGLGRTAELFKMSARELDAWGGVLKSVGGDANDFQSSIQSIQQGVAGIQFGDTAILETLAKLQALGAYDYSKQEVDIYKLADAIKRFSDINGEQAAYVQAQAMGINRNFFMVLKQGSGVVRELYGENYRLSGVTEENTKKAQKLQEAWGKVGQALSGATNQITDQMYPSLEKLAGVTQLSLEKFVEWDKSMDGGLSKAVIFAGGIGTLMSAFQLLGVSVATQMATVAKWGSTVQGIVTSGWFMRFLGAVGLATYSEGLNKGEDKEIRKIREAQDKELGITRNEKTGAIEKFSPSEDKEKRKFQEEQLTKMGVTWNAKTGEIINNGRPAAPASKEAAENFGNLEKKYNLPAGMLDKIWEIESSRGKNMESPAGATGHFQFMPKTAAQYGLSREDTYDLNKSSDAAARMMSDLMKQFKGDERKAIAAYNWGSGNVTNKGIDQLPDETIKYLQKYGVGAPPQQNQDYLKNNARYMGANVAAPANQTSSTSNSEVNIQNVNVQTQATDAKGIAQDMKMAIQNNSLINMGMVGNR